MTLVQVIAWCRQVASPSSMKHYGVNRPHKPLFLPILVYSNWTLSHQCTEIWINLQQLPYNRIQLEMTGKLRPLCLSSNGFRLLWFMVVRLHFSDMAPCHDREESDSCLCHKFVLLEHKAKTSVSEIILNVYYTTCIKSTPLVMIIWA